MAPFTIPHVHLPEAYKSLVTRHDSPGDESDMGDFQIVVWLFFSILIGLPILIGLAVCLHNKCRPEVISESRSNTSDKPPSYERSMAHGFQQLNVTGGSEQCHQVGNYPFQSTAFPVKFTQGISSERTLRENHKTQTETLSHTEDSSLLFHTITPRPFLSAQAQPAAGPRIDLD
ncbi:hypothetical protein BGZ63DRAFT_424609 [Mariannaea sp. PMI_226]|nr:hypothetical protein BGZ63DRAFT_424609 [Mariannaea sp. PMI_226]